MPFDAPPTPKPDFAALAYVLRHPEMWPPGFHWNYQYRDRCAIGLGIKMGLLPESDCDIEAFDMLGEDYDAVFLSAAPAWTRLLPWVNGIDYTRPRHVAAKLEKYLRETRHAV